jgi:hypothetical protein
VPLFDKPAPLSVRHRLEAVVCAELPIDVVQVIPKRLGRDLQLAGDGRGVAALGKERKDAALLLGERRDWRVILGAFGDRNELPCALEHAMQHLLIPMSPIDVVSQPDEKSSVRSRILKNDGRDVHPNAGARLRLYLEVEVRNATIRIVPRSRRRFGASAQCGSSQQIASFEDFINVPVKYLIGCIPKEPLGGVVPRADLATIGDCVRGVRGVLEQCEQFGFQHRSKRLAPSRNGRHGRDDDACTDAEYERFIVARQPTTHSFIQ